MGWCGSGKSLSGGENSGGGGGGGEELGALMMSKDDGGDVLGFHLRCNLTFFNLNPKQA